MNKKAFVCILLVSGIFLSACATIQQPTSTELASANYGSYPNDYQEIIKAYMSKLLFDPYSAVYSDWKGPSKGWAGGGFEPVAFGYRVCVEVNAKNRMGAYVGTKLLHFVIHNGQVVKFSGTYNYGTLGEELAHKLCSSVYNEPPPTTEQKDAGIKPITIPQKTSFPTDKPVKSPSPWELSDQEYFDKYIRHK